MKRSIFAILLLSFLLLVAVPVYAYSPPGQGTDNATDIIIWHGDTANVTAVAAVTVAGLEDAMVAAADEIADQLGIISVAWLLTVFLFGMALLAYIGKDRPLFAVAGFGFVINGFAFLSTSIWTCILMVLAGIFLVIRAFTKKGIV